jgi:hypothetical protein
MNFLRNFFPLWLWVLLVLTAGLGIACLVINAHLGHP